MKDKAVPETDRSWNLSLRDIDLATFHFVTFLKQDPWCTVDNTIPIWDQVLQQVASHISDRPPAKGKMIIPLGHLLSPLQSRRGSSYVGTNAAFRARLVTSLMAASLKCWPAPGLHDRGYTVNTSREAAQRHFFERHIRTPRRWERATRNESPSNEVQTDDDGTALCHAPDRGMLAALKHAWRCWFNTSFSFSV